MSLSVGIVGFPNVGKSTLFQALTQKEVGKLNYPFCTIDPNIGIVSVLDNRLDKLSRMANSKKTVYSSIKFVDIAGIVEGANKGEGLGNKFLANIRETDLIIYVLRAFTDEGVISVRDKIDPIEESILLETELSLKDLDVIEKRMISLEKEIRSRKKEAIIEMSVIKKAKEAIENGFTLISLNLSKEEKEILQSYRFLTMKPKIYLLNGSSNDISDETRSKLEEYGCPVISIDIANDLDSSVATEEDNLKIIDKSKLDILIQESYNLLGLITFFTVGPEESRAWKIKKETLAPDAAGTIHTDFKSNFIKADVINWEDLFQVGGLLEAKKRGMIKTEGKNYIIKDGDVVEIKHGA